MQMPVEIPRFLPDRFKLDQDNTGSSESLFMEDVIIICSVGGSSLQGP